MHQPCSARVSDAGVWLRVPRHSCNTEPDFEIARPLDDCLTLHLIAWLSPEQRGLWPLESYWPGALDREFPLHRRALCPS